MASYEPKFCSASQIRGFAWDREEWRQRYLLGIRPPPTPAMEAGKKFHAEMETALRALAVDPALDVAPDGVGARIWGAARDTLQAFGPGLDRASFECAFYHPIEGTTVLTQFLGYLDVLHVTPRKARIWDHKTVADPNKAKTPHQLKQDIQMMLYAAVYSREGAEPVELVHNYVMRTGPHRQWSIRTEVTHEEAQDYLHERIMPLVREMDGLWMRWQDTQRKKAARAERATPAEGTTDMLKTLFVGTWPTKVPEGHHVVRLHDWLADEMDAVTDEQCRLWCSLNFAAGPGEVMEKAHASGKFDDLPELLFVPAGDKLGELALAHLEGSYDLVVNRVY